VLYRSRSEEQNKQVQPVHRILQKRAAFDKTGLLKKKKRRKKGKWAWRLQDS
jgi:hypothetical protein